MATKVETPKAPDPGQTYEATMKAMVGLAPELYAQSAIYDPLFAQLNAQTARTTTLGSQGMTVQGASNALRDMDDATRQQVMAQAQAQGVAPEQWLINHTMKQAQAGDPVAISGLQKYGTWQPGIVDTQIEAAQRMQTAQTGLQRQQLEGNLKNLTDLSGGAVQALRSANPNVAALNDATTQLALGGVPNSQMQAAQAQAGPLVQGANLGFQVNAPERVRGVNDPTLGQANQVVQGMLASGGRISDQEAGDIANKTLSYFNTMGRAQDPAAAAKLALNLDSAQQARMNNAINMTGQVIGYNQGQSGLNLQAQQSNQSAGLQAQGLGLQAASTQAGFNQQAALANQGMLANMNQFNAGMQQQANQYNADEVYRNLAARQALLGQAYAQESAVTNPAIGMVLSPSNGLQYGNAAYGAGAGTSVSAQGFNPYGVGTQLYSQYYGAQQGADVANTNASNALKGAALGMFGTLGGGFLAGGCWVAREAFGTDTPLWLAFREWLFNKADSALRSLYLENGERLAWAMAQDPALKSEVKSHLETILKEVYE